MTATATLPEPGVLDLARHLAQRPAAPRRRWHAVLVGLVLAGGMAVAAAWSWDGGDETRSIRVPLEQQRFIASLNVDDKAGLLVEGADAQTRNAAIPLSGMPVERVAGFSAADDGATYRTALRCLTQAVYYEAATEPLQGRRGVAQVVLNRMRHAAYPNSVCGVVYQGSERRTGCQFSFTCDGSLLRSPAAGTWRQAEDIAKAALAGQVEPSVGTATHYHADYVLPKWAFQLGKIDQIGRHIFYRFNGGWGRASALSARYAGREAIPALDFSALRQRLASGPGTADAPVDQYVPGLTVTPAAFDRHTENDVGGRLDTTKEWRLTIPDPTQASSRYRAALGDAAPTAPDGAKAPAAAAAVEPAPAAPPAMRDKQAVVRAPAREVALR